MILRVWSHYKVWFCGKDHTARSDSAGWATLPEMIVWDGSRCRIWVHTVEPLGKIWICAVGHSAEWAAAVWTTGHRMWFQNSPDIQRGKDSALWATVQNYCPQHRIPQNFCKSELYPLKGQSAMRQKSTKPWLESVLAKKDILCIGNRNWKKVINWGIMRGTFWEKYRQVKNLWLISLQLTSHL